MSPRAIGCALALAALVALSADSGESKQTVCLERLSLRMHHPKRWTVQEVHGGWHLAEYAVSDTQGERGSATSIVLRADSARSIRSFLRLCEASNATPEASGDVLCIPTLATYTARARMLRDKAAPQGLVRVFGGRRFVVEEVHGEGLHLRTYSTFFGNVMVELTFNYGFPPGPDPARADEAVSELAFEEGACRRTSG